MRAADTRGRLPRASLGRSRPCPSGAEGPRSLHPLRAQGPGSRLQGEKWVLGEGLGPKRKKDRPAWRPPSCATLGKCHPLSEFRPPQLFSGRNRHACPTGLLWGLGERLPALRRYLPKALVDARPRPRCPGCTGEQSSRQAQPTNRKAGTRGHSTCSETDSAAGAGSRFAEQGAASAGVGRGQTAFADRWPCGPHRGTGRSQCPGGGHPGR